MLLLVKKVGKFPITLFVQYKTITPYSCLLANITIRGVNPGGKYSLHPLLAVTGAKCYTKN